MENIRILLGIPSYGGQIHIGVATSIFKATRNFIDVRFSGISLLAMNFNTLFVQAYNEKFTHFVLLHSDIEVLGGTWIDKMIEIMQQKNLGVLSVVAPLKSKEGLTSTALDQPDSSIRKLNMFEIATKLPLTFTQQDTLDIFQNDKLLINTGVLCIDLSKVDPTKCYFSIEDKIVKKSNGDLGVENVPEDWNFSRMLMKNGIKYGATREISIKHYGNMSWDNQTVDIHKIKDNLL